MQLSRTNAFFLGGGKALVNAYFDRAEGLGVDVAYGYEVTDLDLEDGRFVAAQVDRGDDRRRIEAGAFVAASGGFEANIPWLKEYWGEAAENFVVRGTPYNQGRVLRTLLDQGAASVGKAREFHAVALDARSPKTDGGIVTRLDSVPFGIVVNKEGRRFYDEGEDFWPKRYAIWGGLIAQQDDQIAYSIFDAKAEGKFMPPVFPTISASSSAELAGKLGLDAEALERTLRDYNAATCGGVADHSRLDGLSTVGLDPPKTNWALPINEAPFLAHPLRPGITFTYLGVEVDQTARVIMKGRGASPNLFAAGEIMCGNILGRGYLAGFGMTIGTIFGRIAGQEAARHALV